MSHIAYVIPTIDRLGGAEGQMLLLATGLIDRGWRVDVVALSGDGGDAADAIIAAGAGFVSLHMRKGLADPRGWILFHRWLRRQKPDVVHAHLPHAAWITRWSRVLAPTRVVVDTVHTPALGTAGRRLGYRWSNWLPDKVTAVSRSAAHAHVAARMVQASKLTVLPNGVDTDHFRPDPEARASVRLDLGLTDEFLWFAAGRLEPVKDYPTLLRAMARVPQSARLTIAGAGVMERELRRLAADSGLACRVRFLGFKPDVRRWMQAADAFVLTSRWEGLPMALLEACCCGLPVVATHISGNREIVVDGQTGLFAGAGDATVLADKMTQMMSMTPEERGMMGMLARQRVIRDFSLKAVLDRWEALYGTLLGQHPHPLRYSDRHSG